MERINTLDFARQQLALAVERGTQKAGPVVERILASQPEDAIVSASSLQFSVGSRVSIHNKTDSWQLHEHAEKQLYERIGGAKFLSFANELSGSTSDWRRQLLAQNLDTLSQHARGKFLVRAVRSGDVREARAVLSDKYRRLDNRPLLDAFIGAATGLGAVPYDGVTSDLSASVRAIIPQIYEPVPGEAIVFGLSWTNSDYGARGYGVSVFVLRLVCLNGMVGASLLKQVHLGHRLPDDLALSQKTYDLDTRTMVSATQDIVRGALSAKSIDDQLDVIRRAATAESDLKSQWQAIGKALTKPETEKVREAFEGQDTINLPAGKTAWRLSNALSWVANADKVNPERKLELQALAGKVVS